MNGADIGAYLLLVIMVIASVFLIVAIFQLRVEMMKETPEEAWDRVSRERNAESELQEQERVRSRMLLREWQHRLDMRTRPRTYRETPPYRETLWEVEPLRIAGRVFRRWL